MSKQEPLLKTKLVPSTPVSLTLFDEVVVSRDESVQCLGLEFENDTTRRTYFAEELRNKLQNPEFRKVAGFPLAAMRTSLP